MSVLAEVRIPTDSFGPWRLFDEYPEVQVEFERVVPIKRRSNPLIRISNLEDDAEPVLQQSGANVLQQLTDTNGGRLYAIRMAGDRSHVQRALDETDVQVLSVVGRSDSWEFRARFADHHELIEFNQHLTQEGVPVTLQRLYNTTPENSDSISDKQREAVQLALQRGYFEIPRQCTIEELAHSVGVSDSAFSQRLRRGIAACARMAVGER